MNNVLLVYPVKHQYPFVKGISESQNKNGVATDIVFWGIETIRFQSRNNVPLISILCSFLFNKLKRMPGFWRLGIATYLKEKCYKAAIIKYSVIYLAGLYTEDRLRMARLAKVKGKSVVIDFWGSDFNSIVDYDNDWHKSLISISDSVFISTRTLEKRIRRAYPSFSDRVKFVPIGLSQLEVLKDIQEDRTSADLSFLDSKSKGKIIITIGYSGRPWQQHFYVLDVMEKLSQYLKERLFLLVPMTYDCEVHYRHYIKSRLEKVGIPFQILENRLSLIQNLSMRIITDIFIITQVDDAMAGSVLEHLMAGSVLIAGDWLPYDELLSEGVYFRKTALDGLHDTLVSVIDNLKEEKAKCYNNRIIIYKLRSWTVIGPQRVKVLKDLLG